jgi:hypothetical protein
MGKNLKDFIDDNRRAFDDDLPSPVPWLLIEKAIKPGNSFQQVIIRNIYKWSAVAAVFFIAAIAIYFVVTRKNEINNKTVTLNQPATIQPGNGTDIGKMDTEFAAEAKKIYQSIELQQLQLKTMAVKQPGLYSQFALDLAVLDSSYRVLKAQAVQTPGREVIIKAMLQNLQLQAELLSKQLMIIQEFNNNKNNNNEKDNNRSI